MYYYGLVLMTIFNNMLSEDEKSDNILNILFFCLFAFILISFLLFLFAVLLRNKMTKMVIEANNARIHISQLNLSVNMLIGESDIVIFRYDINEKAFYRLKDGQFTEKSKTLRQFEQSIHQDDMQTYKNDFNDIISGKTDKIKTSLRCFEPDIASYCDYEFVGKPTLDAQGVMTGILFSSRNETKQKEQIREQQEVIAGLNLALRSGNLIRMQYNIAYCTIKITDSNLNEFFIPKSEVIKVVHKDDINSVYSYLDRILSEEVTGSLIVRLKLSGKWYKTHEVHAILKKNEDGTPGTIHCICVNISNIINYRNQLKEKIDLLETITNNMPTGLIYIDRNGLIREVNSQFIKQLGIKDKALLLNSGSLACFNEIKPECSGKYGKHDVIKTEVNYSYIYSKMHEFMDSTLEHEDVFEISYAGIFGKDDEVIGYIILLNGITDAHKYRDKLEHAKQELELSNNKLQRSEMRLKSILNKLPIPIYLKDFEQQKYIYVNHEAERVYNIKVGNKTNESTSVKNAISSREIERKIIETGEEYTANEHVTLSDGHMVDTFVKKTHIIHSEKDQILVVRIDLTKERQAQIAKRILSASLSSFKAYTWFMDTRDGIIKYSNGESAHSIINLHHMYTIEKFGSYIHPDDRAYFLNNFSEFLKHDNSENSFFFRFDYEGQGVFEWWECRAVIETFKDKGEEYKVIYSFNINIDSQKQTEIDLHESKHKLAKLNKQNEIILNNTNAALIYLDNEFKIQWSNAGHIFGQLSDVLYNNGIRCYAFGHAKETCPDCPAKRALETNRICSHEIDLNQNGTYEVTAIPIGKEGYVDGVVIKVENVTERKRLFDDLKKAKDKAEQSDKLKTAFLANMSHEIRTPLNSIVGFSQLIQYSDTQEERDEYMNIINNNNDLLLSLINDILDLSKIESGAIDISPEKFDLVTVINESFASFNTRFSNKGINLRFESMFSECIVSLDRKRVVQVITNYLSNALKYTNSGEVVIRIVISDNGVRINVSDTGIGIDPQKQHLVFGRFEKLDSFAQGTGLGLAICKAIVESVGGKVGFVSEKGVGSTFWASFPCEAEYVAN